MTGYRAIGFKKPSPHLAIDRTLATLMALCGVSMIALPLITQGTFNIVLTVFGCIGAAMAIGDLRAFKQPDTLRATWLQMHLSKMSGGYIAAVTAFVVVNDVLPGVLGWLTPTILGTVYISYWTRKMKKKTQSR